MENYAKQMRSTTGSPHNSVLSFTEKMCQLPLVQVRWGRRMRI